MPMIQTDSQNYSDIADAIREKLDSQDTYYPSDMAGAIREIPTSSSVVTYVCDLLFENTNITYVSGHANVNETYTLDKSIDNYDAVIVNAYMYVSENGIAEQSQDMFIPKADFYLRTATGSDTVSWAFVMAATYSSDTRRLCFGFDDNVTIKTVASRTSNSVTPTLHKIYGIKFGGQHYSTSEHIVGTWIDNKPVYEKTIDVLTDVTVKYDNWTDITSEVTTSWELIIKSYGTSSNGVYVPLAAAGNDGHLQIRSTLNQARPIRYITVRYTKTTDVLGDSL